MDEGAQQDFAEFAAARSRQLIRLAYVLTGDQHAAEDLLQNALVKAAAHWGRIHTVHRVPEPGGSRICAAAPAGTLSPAVA